MTRHKTQTFRVYRAAAFYSMSANAILHLGDLKRAAKAKRVSKPFAERIMLAVTQVNGCRYCNFYHAKLALKSGVTSEELRRLMAGDLSNAPESEHLALLFAQHYAEAEGHPDEEALNQLRLVYGQQMSDDILAYIRMIMVGNAYGNALYALRLRLLLKPAPDSTIWDELAVVFGALILVPLLLIWRGVRRLLH